MPDTEVWTVQRLLGWMTQDFAALGIPSPRLDAELLLCSALGCDRVRLYIDMQRPLHGPELDAVRALVVRRRRREPVAYILGKRDFYQHELEISSDVLVPRPETELLVDRALEVLPASAACALDLCTGSGAIAIALALQRPNLEIDATDISPAALLVAGRNVGRHQLGGRVRLHLGDLFEALPAPRRYPLLLANPPYVAETEWSSLSPDVALHEPRIALVAGLDGFAVLQRLCVQAADFIEPGGALLFEVGRGQAERVASWLGEDVRFERIATHKDLAGIERLVEARRRQDAS
jgi:release factor glutamine methyltransferase